MAEKAKGSEPGLPTGGVSRDGWKTAGGDLNFLSTKRGEPKTRDRQGRKDGGGEGALAVRA